MPNFDLSNLALQSICPNNEILYDDKGLPSVMVKIPKMTLAELGIGTSTDVHPAFIINGQEVPYIYISKYQNVVENSRAYSLPCSSPQTSLNFSAAQTYCKNKGAGWHLMTRAEWALLALWCKKNGTQPLGNNNRGKDHSETMRIAIPATYSGENINQVATGTGPLTWSHNRTLSGIWDLNGNLHEWVGGIRTVYGELQVLSNNNAADNTKSQAVSSSEWKAIDATTGEYVTPNGSGTTNNTIKMNTTNNYIVYSTSITSQPNSERNCKIEQITCDSSIGNDAKRKLYALALLPNDSTTGSYGNDLFYYNNGASETVLECGGSSSAASGAGVFCIRSDARSMSYATIGFRSAFIKIPSA